MSLDNCKRCGRLFQKNMSPLCRDCFTYEQNQNKEIYRFVQENPGISMEELAQKFSRTQKEIETLVFSGVLGTANQFIRTQCALCKCEMTFVNRIGYFCYACNKFVEKEAGKLPETEQKIENILKGHSAFYDPHPEEKEPGYVQPVTKEAAKPEPPPQPAASKYGFKRISGKTTKQQQR